MRALLFILALAGLSKHETAKVGNTFGIAGMTLALVATIALAIDRDISGVGFGLLVVAMLVGAAIGLWRARVVEMTGMPEPPAAEKSPWTSELMRQVAWSSALRPRRAAAHRTMLAAAVQ